MLSYGILEKKHAFQEINTPSYYVIRFNIKLNCLTWFVKILLKQNVIEKRCLCTFLLIIESLTNREMVSIGTCCIHNLALNQPINWGTTFSTKLLLIMKLLPKNAEMPWCERFLDGSRSVCGVVLRTVKSDPDAIVPLASPTHVSFVLFSTWKEDFFKCHRP